MKRIIKLYLIIIVFKQNNIDKKGKFTPALQTRLGNCSLIHTLNETIHYHIKPQKKALVTKTAAVRDLNKKKKRSYWKTCFTIC